MTATTSGCPARKLVPQGEPAGPAVEHVDDAAGDRWVVRSFTVARDVLRASEGVRQAGFGADQVHRAEQRMRPPVLYLEGAAHRDQRRAAARFFAPKVTEGYRGFMQALSDELVSRLRTDVAVDLSQLSLRLAVQVAAQVIGLTSSPVTGMTRRLDAFFAGSGTAPGRGPLARVRALRRQTDLLRFFYLDVKPAIRARRRQPREDVISQLLEQGFSDLDILTECVTYGAAGMATTREFITVAAWHLLDQPALLQRYREAETAERLAILEETLRLEPVVGHLYRRTTSPLTLAAPDGPQELPAGTLVDLDIRAVNADPSVVGDEPLGLCPSRQLPRTVPTTVLSFGDGHHKCPGGSLAVMETEVFLTTLFTRDVVAQGSPKICWNAVTAGYDLDGFLVSLRP